MRDLQYLLNDPELEPNTDAPVLYHALINPERIKVVPKYMYDHLLRFLEEREEYEYCAEFIKIKPKVVDQTLDEIIQAYG